MSLSRREGAGYRSAGQLPPVVGLDDVGAATLTAVSPAVSASHSYHPRQHKRVRPHPLALHRRYEMHVLAGLTAMLHLYGAVLPAPVFSRAIGALSFVGTPYLASSLSPFGPATRRSQYRMALVVYSLKSGISTAANWLPTAG
jgi:hypothetical protein